ncbi:MAG: carbohydrate ABC transporter permease [Candidatus Limiplasma sp.]|nr:carbohydrate ABC transporter permease [Candidatus Limiplasma sp.]
MRRQRRVNLFMNISFIVLAVLFASPFFIMLTTSLKTFGEIQTRSGFLPQTPMFGNYLVAMQSGNWGRYFLNSIYVTVLAVLISLIINSLAGYAFARLTFKGRDFLFMLCLLGLVVPPQTIMIPVFIILKSFPLAGGNNLLGVGGRGLIDTYAGMLAPYIAGAFGVFIFKQFFMNFPRALDDAARIDGLNRFQLYLRIYVPLSKPVIATMIAIKSTSTWNEYTWPLIITTSEKMRTVQLALTTFRDDYNVQWHLLMAATAIVILPILGVFIFLQKYFVASVVNTGIKG